jgi:hypothetical protein
MRWLFHVSPVVGYVMASLYAYRLSRVWGTYWRWRLGWASFTIGCVLLSFARVFNLLDLLKVSADDWLVDYQTIIVILASWALALGSWTCWRVYREGDPRGAPDG